jgi:hypothetical protein
MNGAKFMTIIVLIPGIVAALIAFLRSPAQAFLSVYVPVLVLVPEYYRWTVPLLPKVTASQGTIVAILAVAIVRKALRWQPSQTDVLIFGLLLCIAVSEYTNAGYKEAQNLTFDMLAWFALPYVAGKCFIEPLGLRLQFARRLVFLIFVVAIVSCYEFRLGRTAFRIPLDPFFGGQGSGWVTTFRWGFARIAGPYGHAILAGVIFAIGYRIHRWLELGNHWEPHFKRFRNLPLSKAALIRVGLIGGSIMTMCRGPWIGAAAATVVVVVGRSPSRALAMRVVLAAAIFLGIPAMIAFHSYVSVGRQGAKTVAQESAAYRKELMDKYTDIVMEKSILGWGRNTWPKVSGMSSIDNYYLQLSLMHGLSALFLFCLIIVTMAGRLALRGASCADGSGDDATLAFSLCSIYIAIAISIATVYMGTQLIPLFGLLTGWSEALLNRPTVRFANPAVAIIGAQQFRRIVT